MKIKILALLFIGSLFTFNTHAQIKHTSWDALLKKYVSASGHVNYKGFVADKAKLNAYCDLLSKNAPKASWSKNQKLAYWINAYNAFTVKLIVDNYPVKSIKELGGSVYKVNTPWDKKFIKIGGETLDLNNIEHQKIRGNFNEPRIHFAVNCASISCPKLRNEAFTASKLEAQLTAQTKYFLKHKNTIDGSNPKLSKIFKWYAGDFKKKEGSVTAFINKYSTVKIKDGAPLSYLNYNWNLNGK